MNITLSADKELVKKAREFAAQQGTSLNQIIRQYMEQLTRISDIENNAEEFAQLAREKAGASPKGYIFNREEAHMRGTDQN